MEPEKKQQHDKIDSCQCVAVCNPMNHMAEKTLGSSASKQYHNYKAKSIICLYEHHDQFNFILFCS
jgi:hypothetical protein